MGARVGRDCGVSLRQQERNRERKMGVKNENKITGRPTPVMSQTSSERHRSRGGRRSNRPMCAHWST
jgi:hypothetical protein